MLLNKWLASPTAIASGVEGVFVKDAAAIIPMSKQPFLDEIVGLETAVTGTSNVNGMNGMYVLGTAMRGRLKTKPIAPKSSRNGSYRQRDERYLEANLSRIVRCLRQQRTSL